MDSPGGPLGATRRSLHAVAETVLAGPQHRETGTIRLVVTPGGFATLPGGPRRLSVVGTELVVQDHGEDRVVPLTGSLGEVAAAAGVDLGAPQGVYHGTTGATATDVLEVDAAAAALLADAFERGDKALRAFAGRVRPSDPPVPVLWPEHFDLGISLDEVNFGVSPGDSTIAEPYAYVGPWQPRRGDFWDRPFGAARLMRTLPDAGAVAAFFDAGRLAAAQDPRAV